MRDFSVFILLIFSVLSGCRNTSGLLPDADLNYLKKYHCWPYDVTVYSVGDMEIDSLFFCYPLPSYFSDNSKYQITTWEKYADFDTSIWVGMSKVLSQCDGDQGLYDKITRSQDIYYAGSYQYLKNRQGVEMKSYEKILFIDVKGQELHLFKNLDKVY